MATPKAATLLDVLIDGFEKNETFNGFHARLLPLPDEASARDKLDAFAKEATAWKGPPERDERTGSRRVVRWPDLELWQAGRGVVVRARAARFDTWWHAPETWRDDPMGSVHAWIHEASTHDARERSNHGG